MADALCRQVGGDIWHPEDYEPTIHDLLSSGEKLTDAQVIAVLINESEKKTRKRRSSRKKPQYPATVKKAKKVCMDCPVQQTCLDHAITHNEIHGIWGGLTPTERRRYRSA